MSRSIQRLFIIFFFCCISELCLYPRSGTCSGFRKNPCPQEFICQTAMHLIRCICQQELKSATGWVIYLWQQSATSFWRNDTRSSVTSRIKNPHCTCLRCTVWCLDKGQVSDSSGGNWRILWCLRAKHTFLQNNRFDVEERIKTWSLIAFGKEE